MATALPTAQPSADPGTEIARPLRNLYVVRFAFALVWAGVLATHASDLDLLSRTLLVLYPLFDLAAAAYDLRTAGATRHRGALYANIALSLLAAGGLAGVSDTPDALRVWGAWAVAAGAVQLVVALRRRRVGGQLPMVLSGGLSVLAGLGIAGTAGQDDPSLAALAGYATLGGVFFLLSAIRLGRELGGGAA